MHMRTCKVCGESMEPPFDSCWKCANGGREWVPAAPVPHPKPCWAAPKATCPVCKTLETLHWSPEGQMWECASCHHPCADPPEPVSMPSTCRICQTCCNVSRPVQSNGMVWVVLILILIVSCLFKIGLLGLLIILLALVRSDLKRNHRCPECGTPYMVSVNSPKGRDILQKYGFKIHHGAGKM